MGERDVRAGIARLKNGAGELAIVAVVMPLFLAGLELAAAGFAAGGFTMAERGPREASLDRALYVVYFVALVSLAVRARIAAARASRLLPELLAADEGTRLGARERLLRLAGNAKLRAFYGRITAERAVTLLLAFFVVAAFAWIFVPTPNPVWLTIFAGTVIAIDARWRGLVADAADQVH